MKRWRGVVLVMSMAIWTTYTGWALADSAQMFQVLQKTRDKYDFPGLAAIVIKGGKIDSIAAIGLRKYGDPAQLTTNDVFHIGSCTKSMTATVAASLIEQGTLQWNTTIGEVFPELKKQMNEQYRAVTLQQLLRHRGGVPAQPPEAAWQRAWRRRGTSRQQRYEFIRAVLAERPEVTPGTKYVYSNQGYAIAGAMLERITGKPYEELMTERLFKPLHMGSAGFGPPATEGRVDQPWGHIRQGSTNVALQQDNPPAIAPGGTVHCSLPDLAKYAICHLHGEQPGGLLKPETFRRLHTPAEGGDYACGWICAERDWAGGVALTHSGSNTMWYVVIWLAPAKDFGVIVGTNTGASEAFKGCDEVAGALIRQWREAAQ